MSRMIVAEKTLISYCTYSNWCFTNLSIRTSHVHFILVPGMPSSSSYNDISSLNYYYHLFKHVQSIFIGTSYSTFKILRNLI